MMIRGYIIYQLKHLLTIIYTYNTHIWIQVALFFSCAILLLAVRRQRDIAYIEIEVFGEMDNVELHSGTRSPAVLTYNIIDTLQYIYIIL